MSVTDKTSDSLTAEVPSDDYIIWCLPDDVTNKSTDISNTSTDKSDKSDMSDTSITLVSLGVSKRLLTLDPACYFTTAFNTVMGGSETTSHTSTYPLKLIKTLIYVLSTLDIYNYKPETKLSIDQPALGSVDKNIMSLLSSNLGHHTLAEFIHLVDYYRFNYVLSIILKGIWYEIMRLPNVKYLVVNYQLITRVLSIVPNDVADKILVQYFTHNTDDYKNVRSYSEVMQLLREQKIPNTAIMLCNRALEFGGILPYDALRCLTKIEHVKQLKVTSLYYGSIYELSIFLLGVSHSKFWYTTQAKESLQIYHGILSRFPKAHDYIDITVNRAK
jgi:hypothetical protein